MWKSTVMVGTIVVALLGGAAVAVASQGHLDVPVVSDTPPSDDWSPMPDDLGGRWQEMFDHMSGLPGTGFDDMIDMMGSFGSDMFGSGDGFDMGGVMGGSMGSFGSDMFGSGDGFDMGGMNR